MKHAESSLQISIVTALRWAHRDMITVAVPNGGARSKITGAILKAEGVTAGFPDIIVIWPAGIGFIEVKTATGRVGPDQRIIHTWLEAMGHRVAVVRSVDQALAVVKAWRAA